MKSECNYCSNKIDESVDFYRFNKDGDMVCESCEAECWNEAVRVMHFDSNSESLDAYLYSYILGDTRRGEDFEEVDIPEPIVSAKWEPTDSWRGYVYVDYKENFEVVANGWTTGNYDDVKWKWDFNEFYENVQSGELVPPVDVWFVFAQTSNVFSTAVDVVVHNHQAATFLNWLAEEAGMTRDELNQALS